ncbi:MAG: DUF4358 domain-containing protein [Anaerovoracaceae bacterium]
MKKILSVLLITVMCIGLVACGSDSDKEAKDIDVDDFASYVMDNYKFEDQLTKLDSAMIGNIYQVEEGVEATLYIGSGATAEEIAIFKTTDKSKLSKMKENIDAHIEKQKTDFASYMPKETKKLDNAVVEEYSSYIAVVVCNEVVSGSIFEKYCEE